MGTQQIPQDSSTGTKRQSTSVARRGATRVQRKEHAAVVKDAPKHYSETPDHKDAITKFLGWFSIGLGLAEVLAPTQVARLIGLDEEDEHTTLIRAFGMRELAAGVGILARPKPTYWLWNRVLGDTMDVATLGKAMRNEKNDRTRLLATTLAVLGVTALDIVQSVRLTSEKLPATGHDEGSFELAEAHDGVQHVGAAITVNRPVEEVYEFWKNAQNFSRFMSQIESVRITGGGHTYWKAKAPAGLSVEWDAVTVEDVPNELISWQSVDSSEVDNTGTVRFARAAGDRGTEVRLEMEFRPKGGVVGAKLARFFAMIPKTQLQTDLRRFKQLIELGEIVHSDASIHKGMHPARPSERSEREG
jgi:uncharacterized membrane protein